MPCYDVTVRLFVTATYCIDADTPKEARAAIANRKVDGLTLRSDSGTRPSLSFVTRKRIIGVVKN